jgi:hypothetical protein
MEFERSLALYPTRSALFNVANCQKALHRYVAALRTFERWQAEFGADAPPEEQEIVRDTMEELRGFIGELTVVVDVAGAGIFVDGEQAGVAPLAEPLLLDLGRHVIEARLEGYQTATREVPLGGGDRADVALSLVPAAAGSVAPVEPPVPGAAVAGTGGAGLHPAWFWATAGTAAALGVAAGITGGVTYDVRQDFEAGGHLDADLADRGETLQATAWALAGVAGAAAVAAVVLAFFTDFGGSEEPVETASGGTALLPGGVVIAW